MITKIISEPRRQLRLIVEVAKLLHLLVQGNILSIKAKISVVRIQTAVKSR